MTKKIATRGGQYPLVFEFSFNFDDTMVDVNGDLIDFGAADVAAPHTFEVSGLPDGAVLVGGAIYTEEVFDAATYNITVGDNTDPDRSKTTVDAKAVGVIALVPTGAETPLGDKLTITVTPADACTTGAMTLRAHFIVPGRINESYPA